MTIQELYDWAKEKGYENFDLCCNYRDGGGWHNGYEEATLVDIEIIRDRREVII